MDLLCRWFYSVRAMMLGESCVVGRACMSMMVVCIPLVFRTIYVIAGWVYGCVGMGFVIFGGVWG